MIKYIRSFFTAKRELAVLAEEHGHLYHKYNIALDTIKYIYYTSNNARPEWEIADEAMRKLGEV